MATAPPSLSSQPPDEPNGAATVAPLTAPSGLSKSARFAMWIVVLTLCLIALSPLSKVWFDSQPWSAAQQTQKQTQAKILELEIRTSAALAAVAAASDAAASARASAACAAAIAAGDKRARDCAKGFAVDARGSLPAGPTATDPLRPVADIAKMTLDASKEKYDSIKDANDRLFSVLAAMGALLAFLGFTGLDSFLAAKNTAQKSEQRAHKAEQRADAASWRAEVASEKLDQFLEKTSGLRNRAELNVSNGIALRETARVYKDIWALLNPNPLIPAMPQSGDKDYQGYLKESLRYLEKAMQEKDKLDDVVIQRAMGTQCNVHRALGDYSDALRVAEVIIAEFGDKGDPAHYNAACYCSLLGDQFTKANMPAEGNKYTERAFIYLKAAISIDPANQDDARKDDDFVGLKNADLARFEKMVE